MKTAKTNILQQMMASPSWPKETVERVELQAESSRPYIFPLQKPFNQQVLNQVLPVIKKELGITQEIIPTPIYTLEDLKPSQEEIIQLNIVENLGREFKGNALLFMPKKVESFSFAFNYNERGNVQQEVDMNGETKAIRITQKDIYLKNPLDTDQAYHRCYTELAHYILLPTTARLISQNINVVHEKGEYHFHNLHYAREISNLTDEAVVHGLCHHWLEELHIPNEEKESHYLYQGAQIIKEKADQEGRKAILESYQRDPMRYWRILQDNVPEYCDLEAQHN